MEWVEVIKRTKEYIKLRYYPTQDSAVGAFGEVTYFFATDKWNFDKLADGYSLSYAMHACNFARERCKNGEEIPQSGLMAWY